MKARTIEGPNGQNYIQYECPGCASFESDVPRSTHVIPYGGDRWQFNGDLERPTISPSILSNVGGASKVSPICHHFVRDGRIQYLNDSTHSLAGQTIDLPEIEGTELPWT